MYDNIIIIPYRHRKKHLDFYINNTIPLLEKNLINFKLVIIEQNEGKLFNRGKLLNIGFTEYKNKTKYFITHDVDINPNIETIKKYYLPDIEKNTIKGVYTSHCNTLGGIVKINNDDIFKINGFPNNYWGWGCEDKALQNRSEYYNINISKNILNNNPKKNDYFKIFNDINDRKSDNKSSTKHNFEYHTFKRLNKTEKEKRILSSGLNNIEYTIIERKEISNNIEIIKVDI